MLENKYRKLPLGSIKPQGWIKNQLSTQAKGLSGNVRFLFKDLSVNSAWLGGKGESWERGPYYLDGLIPLAYLLQDLELISEVNKWIDAIISSQKDDGFFGPIGNRDWWPRMVVTKEIISYYEVTNDNRIIPFLDKYYRYMLKNIDAYPFYSWANVRGCEELIGICWLFETTSEAYLLELMNKVLAYSVDFCKVFSDFKYKKPSSEYYKSSLFNLKKVTFYGGDYIRNLVKAKPIGKGKVQKRNLNPFNLFYHLTHGVNLAMALKYPALAAKVKEMPELASFSKKGYSELIKYHGNALGLFSSDEHISGCQPTQGVELCAVVEALFSFEKLFEITGDFHYLDSLELVAFNALPATFTSDMKAHQYVQQVNQISATVAKRNWYDSYNKANIYGLKPNYACCLSNMHQGFPRFVEHAAYSSENGIVILSPIDMEIETWINDEKLSLKVNGGYPFKQTVIVEITEGAFTLTLHKPSNTKYLRIKNTATKEDFLPISGESVTLSAKEGDVFEIFYDSRIVNITNQDKSSSYYFGNLLLAYNVESKVKYKQQNNPYSDREFFPVSEWNYAPDLGKEHSITFNEIASEPFSAFPLSVHVKARIIENWQEKNNSADAVPLSPYGDKEKTISLVPYGCTNLRIAQFPKI